MNLNESGKSAIHCLVTGKSKAERYTLARWLRQIGYAISEERLENGEEVMHGEKRI
jgi:hypothetical protein